MRRGEGDLLNRLTRVIDSALRCLLGIQEFSSNPDCIYRLSIENAPRDMILPDGTVFYKNERIGVLHIWGDHMPAIPSVGLNLAWGIRMARVLRRSNCLLAQHAVKDKSLQTLSAFGNDFFFPYTKASVHLLERIGFAVLEGAPADCLHERVRLRTARLWAWLLRRAFNQQSVRGISPGDLQYRSVWMSRRTLLEKYGVSSAVASRLSNQMSAPAPHFARADK